MVDALPFGPANGFGLYVHWPYCTRICPYCDFNVYAAKDRETKPLSDALLTDLERHRQALPGHPELTSIYLGGGTPSLMAPGEIEDLIVRAGALFGLEADAEITLEANPVDVSSARLADWQSAGVNRLSLGIQSLDDEALGFLGRDHDAGTARRTTGLALSAFDNVSIDLIYARPGQSHESWEKELTEALALGAPHLSLYELTIEARTAFGKRAARGDLIPMPDDDQADLYELTQDICNTQGLPAYEVSNHAAGTRYRSRHNLTYWRGGDWMGIGPGAHGRLTVGGSRLATHAAPKPADYGAAVSRTAGLDGETLTPIDNARELLALGLRSNEGVDLAGIDAVTGKTLDRSKLADLKETGLIRTNGQMVSLTASGRLLADRIAAELSP